MIVLNALATGASVNQAAAEAGIHRNTIANWRNDVPGFQMALSSAQYDRALHFREAAAEMTDLAFHTLRAIMSDEKATPSVRLRAALAVVKLSTSQAPLPQMKRAPIVAVGVAENCENAHNMHNDPEPDPPVTSNGKVETFRRDHAKIGRNDVCPCGSGLKYKRCCLNKPVSAAAA